VSTITTVSSKGQVVIPAEIRRRFGIEAGSELEFVEDDLGLRIIVHRTSVPSRTEDGFGMLVYEGPPRRLADFDVAEAMAKGRKR
jgi:antitoxin PrlF